MKIEYCKKCSKQLSKRWTERMTTEMVCLNCPKSISEKVGESFGKRVPTTESITRLLNPLKVTNKKDK